MDLLMAEHVAVKEVIFPPMMEMPDMAAVAKVRSEFEMLVSLRHPHVVGVRGLDLLGDRAHIYMDWMPGGSLSQMLASFKFRLPEPLIRHCMRQVLVGLAYLHSRSVVHRDIKPANILVAMDGTMKLSDFGTCKTLSGNTVATTKMVGTPIYMSPEAIRGKATFASDVWGLATCLVEMASYRPPWFELDESILANHYALAIHIGTVQGHHPAYPPTLSLEGKDFLDKCFVIDPVGRATCQDLLLHPFVAASATEGVEEITTYLKMRDTSVIVTLNGQLALYEGARGLNDGAPLMNLEWSANP